MTVDVTVGTLTTATGVTPMVVGGVETTGGISETLDTAGKKEGCSPLYELRTEL